jgi:hypothetical protein
MQYYHCISLWKMDMGNCGRQASKTQYKQYEKDYYIKKYICKCKQHNEAYVYYIEKKHVSGFY